MTRRAVVARLRRPVLLLAAVSYLPAFLQSPGRVSADTKTYLYLDPWSLLNEAAKAWDPTTGAGMVTHQKIGYLWPMGPYYLLMDLVGSPDWVAQRLWWGSLVFLAGLGVHRLARRLEFATSAALVASLGYSLSPYLFQYIARVSGLLLPWVGLPWLVYCAVRARDDRTWRWPLVTGLVVASVGSINATTTAMALLGWLTWVVADVLGGVSKVRAALSYTVKSAVAISALNLWWVAALVVQGAYGVPILRYTESYEVIAASSTPLEVLRGLGYWFFYGGDPREPWVGPASDYLQNRIVLVASFSGVAISLLALALYRGRSRFNVCLLLVVGLGVAVGATPFRSPSLYGRFFKSFVATDLGGALRSAPRAAPLVVLALSLALGWGSGRARENLRSAPHGTRQPTGRARTFGPRLAGVVVPATVVLIGINAFPWFTGTALTDWITRDESIPGYWEDAARAIDATSDPATGFARTYEFPGIPFASYSWGGTIDPITPGIVVSDVVAREQVPIGSEATMDLLSAVESRLQEARADRNLVTDFARSISATAVDWRGDLRHLDYGTPHPAQLAAALPDLVQGRPRLFGPVTTPAQDEFLGDRRYFARPRAERHSQVAVWTVANSRPLLSLSPVDTLTVLAGSGQGVVDALAADVLDPLDTYVYEASRPYLRDGVLFDAPAHFILTDSNRRTARSWDSVGRTEGRTERADEEAPPSRRDSRLMPFVDDPSLRPSADQQSVSTLVGPVEQVVTNQYGSEFGFLPEDRPENLVDGDPGTSWRTGGQGRAIGNWARIDYRQDQTATFLRITAATGGREDRPITSGVIELIDSAGNIVRELGYAPHGGAVSTLRFPRTRFRSLRFEITGDKWTEDGRYIDQPTTGIAEITPGSQAETAPTVEFIRLPVSSPDVQSAARRLSVVLTRWRNDADGIERSDPEPVLRRAFVLSSSRRFTAVGEVRPSTRATRGLSGAGLDAVEVGVNSRLAGTARSMPERAFDGDTRTSWISDLPLAMTPRFDVTLGTRSSDRLLSLVVVSGPHHSLPTDVTLTDSDGRRHRVTLRGADRATSEVEQSLVLTAQIPGEVSYPIRELSLDGIRRTMQPGTASPEPIAMPVEVSEIILGMYRAGSATAHRSEAAIDRCRDDLVRIDGRAHLVRLVIDPAVPRLDGPHRLESCEPLELAAGQHTLEAVDGALTGLDIDRIVLDSGDAPLPPGPSKGSRVPVDTYDGRNLRATVSVAGPSVVSFAQSISRGWKATLTTGDTEVDLGAPFVVNGYSNGWQVPSSGLLVLEWSPQRKVDLALDVSGVAAVLSLVVLLLGSRRKATKTPLADERPVRATLAVVAGLLLLLAGPVAAACVVLGRIAPVRRVAVLVGTIPAVVGGVIIWMQGAYGYPATVIWPTRFEPAIPWIWTAVALAAGAMQRQSASDGKPAPDPRR